MATRKDKDEPLVGAIICNERQVSKVLQMLLYSPGLNRASPLNPQSYATNFDPRVARYDTSLSLQVLNHDVDIGNELLLPEAPSQGYRCIEQDTLHLRISSLIERIISNETVPGCFALRRNIRLAMSLTDNDRNVEC